MRAWHENKSLFFFLRPTGYTEDVTGSVYVGKRGAGGQTALGGLGPAAWLDVGLGAPRSFPPPRGGTPPCLMLFEELQTFKSGLVPD